MGRETIEDIARGSLLHDIGLRCIVVPYENTNLSDLPLKDQIELKSMLYMDTILLKMWTGYQI